jgi:hypothetical protein
METNRRTFTATMVAWPLLGGVTKRKQRMRRECPEALKTERQRTGQTISEAATRAGIPVADWRAMERGELEPFASQLPPIADSLRTTVDDLLFVRPDAAETATA